jgi:hypothetical protein
VDRSVGHTLQVWFWPVHPLWHLGPGWAAIGAGLAAGEVPVLFGGALSPGGLKAAFQTVVPAQVLTLLLVWFLADPLLGTVWELGVGAPGASARRGIWFHALRGPRPDDAARWVTLPYTQPGSPGWRLAGWLAQLRDRWRADSQPGAGHAFVTLVACLGAALVTGAALGHAVTALVVVSAVLSWLVARLQGVPASTARPGVLALRALGEFGIPWLIGCLAFGPLSWPAVALGVCYAIVYAGMLQQPSRFRLTGGGQLAVVWLLVGLRQPIAAMIAAVMLIVQWGLHVGSQDNAAHATGLYACQPLILLGLVGAVLAVGL